MAKRIFDIVVSSIILLCFLPFGILIALMILLESRGGIFYVQERIGLHGVPFGLFKFRTMRKNADREGKLTVGMKDSRITKVGYFLRRFKLDEFPQFLNVLLGDMSIVGPRPEVEEYVKLYTEEQRRVLDVRPGITDYASLEYFDENALLGKSDNPQRTYIEEIMPKKIALNQRYIDRSGLREDVKLLFLTAKKMIGA
ncbi:MAG: sugar transferase [Bacteroidetes bacterium]|nr:MAG: sugar transferase [Bacteroidota bacterium]